MSVKILGLVDCFNNPEFGPLTKHRPMASTTFLGRYAFIDFPLSNFLNSGINSIGVLCQNHIRSLTKHVGNGRSWISNTKIGDFQVLYDEPNVANPGYNTDIACLVENWWYVRQVHPDYIVITSPNMTFEADYASLVEDHIASGSRISMLYKHFDTGLRDSYIDADKLVIKDGKVVEMNPNRGETEDGDISLGTIIVDYPMLESLIEYSQHTSSFFNLVDALSYNAAGGIVRAVKVDTFVRDFDSLAHYLEYSLDFLKVDTFRALFKDNWPIHTRTYDTPPSVVCPGAKVSNAMLANGCHIEGEVSNSILGRGVVVKKGAVVKNCLISSDAVIDENVYLENVVVDREAKVIHTAEIVGTPDDPMYIARGDIV